MTTVKRNDPPSLKQRLLLYSKRPEYLTVAVMALLISFLFFLTVDSHDGHYELLAAAQSVKPPEVIYLDMITHPIAEAEIIPEPPYDPSKYERANNMRKLITEHPIENGMLMLDAELLAFTVQDFGIDLLVESGSPKDQLMTEYVHHFMPGTEIHKFGPEAVELKQTLGKVITHVGDSSLEIAKLLEENGKKKIGIIFDVRSPDAVYNSEMISRLFIFPAVRFVAFYGTAPKFGRARAKVKGSFRLCTWEPGYRVEYAALPSGTVLDTGVVLQDLDLSLFGGMDIFFPRPVQDLEEFVYHQIRTLRKILSKDALKDSMDPLDNEVLIAATRDFGINLLLQVDVSDVVVTEVTARYFPNLEIHKFDLNESAFNDSAKKRFMWCCPNVESHLGDTTDAVLKLVQEKSGAKIGVVIDGSRPDVRDFTKTLLENPAVSFVAIWKTSPKNGFEKNIIPGATGVSTWQSGYRDAYSKLPGATSLAADDKTKDKKSSNKGCGLDLFIREEL